MSTRLSAIARGSTAPCLIATAALLAAGAVQATVVVPLTERQLAERADRIVVGRCTATETRWLDRVLVTAATIEVTDTLKGEPAGVVTLLLPGGVDFDRPVAVQMTFPGAPRVAAGEELFLFLSAAEDLARGALDTPYLVTGYSQGKLEIVRDVAGEPVVHRRGNAVRLGDGDRGGNPQTAVPLADYEATIRAFLAGESAPEGREK